MPSGKHETLYGWGHAQAAECVSFRPEKRRELAGILSDRPGPLIARGLGRSYGDASLQPNGTLCAERLDHLIAFNDEQGIVCAQAGLALGTLMDIAIPRGWLPPVIPGTRFVTLGGAFACNVHGKNHWRAGEFAEHVISIRLTLASGESIECSPEQNADIFWATAGGMGMTGIIEEVTLQLKPIASASLATVSYTVNSAAEMIAAFEQYRDSAEYMVGWIDHMARGKNIGSGVFEAASHVSEGGKALSKYEPFKIGAAVPCFAPSWLLNRYTMALYNRLRFRRYSSERKAALAGLDGFFHPLDRIGHWNRLYGQRGFFQYQCLIPETADMAGQIAAFLSAIQEQGLFSFLAVIKYHRDGKGPLTFSKRGYSIALDFPNTARVRDLLPKIDRWISSHGGRTYLAKDAVLTPELFGRMYGADAWRDTIRRLDPAGRFSSLMSERLQWKTPS